MRFFAPICVCCSAFSNTNLIGMQRRVFEQYYFQNRYICEDGRGSPFNIRHKVKGLIGLGTRRLKIDDCESTLLLPA